MLSIGSFTLSALTVASSNTSPVVPLHMHQEHLPPSSPILRSRGHDLPVDGAVFPTAMYYAMVQVGTPPRDYAVGLDSGSGDLFVEGKGCKGCTLGPPNSQYDPSASASSKSAGGSFHHSYQTCSMVNPSATCTIYGNMYTDEVSLGGLGPVVVKVGAIQSQTSSFDTKKVVGGLMGLGGFDGEDVLATLANAGKCDRIWGVCMYEGRESNGTMTVGGVDESLSDGPIQYVPDQGFVYNTVEVKSLTLGNHEVHVGDGAVLDSGTNILLLGSSVYSQLQQAMCSNSSLAHCAGLWSNDCFEMSNSEVEQFPPLRLQLDGVELEMSSREYLLQGSPLAASAGQYCLGIRNGGRAGFIIGATTMKNYYVVFDKKQQRIGWGKVNKGTCGSMKSRGSATSVVI